MQCAQLMAKHTAQLAGMQRAYAAAMKISSARHLRRRERLDELVKEAGGASELARLAGTPKSHVSALQSGNRGIGDELAAKFEAVMEKAAGWMDEIAAVDPKRVQLSEEAVALGQRYDKLDPEGQARMLALLDIASAGIAAPDKQRGTEYPNTVAPSAPAPSRRATR